MFYCVCLQTPNYHLYLDSVFRNSVYVATLQTSLDASLVIDYPTRINHALEESISFVLIQFKLQGFHVVVISSVM